MRELSSKIKRFLFTEHRVIREHNPYSTYSLRVPDADALQYRNKVNKEQKSMC